MTSVRKPDAEVVEEQAARWFAKRDREDWTIADQAAFEAWISESVEHRVAYIRLDAAWKRAARLKALAAGVPPGVRPARNSFHPFRVRLTPRQGLRSVAPTLLRSYAGPVRARSFRSVARKVVIGLLGAAGASAIVFAFQRLAYDSFLGERITTPIGAIETVRLEDGSRVTLNTNTSIRVLETSGARRIYIDNGEAYFEVARDASRPFVVLAGEQRVSDIGTRFAVRRDDRTTQVVVAEGSVQLAPSPSGLTILRSRLKVLVHLGSGQGAPDLAAHASADLAANDIAWVTSTGTVTRSGVAAEAERLLSWRKGFLAFDDTPLSAAVAEFNRYYKKRIIILDPSIGQIRIGGNFQTSNADGFLWLLERGFPIVAEREGDDVVLRKRP